MAQPKPALYAAGVTSLGFVCLALACFTAFVPVWGHYQDNSYNRYDADRGYFGPWKVCKKLNYNREVCGDHLSFRISSKIYHKDVFGIETFSYSTIYGLLICFILFFLFFIYLPAGVYISGILALISCICFAIFALLSIIQIAMITSRDKIVIKYKALVIIKQTLAIVAGKFFIDVMYPIHHNQYSIGWKITIHPKENDFHFINCMHFPQQRYWH